MGVLQGPGEVEDVGAEGDEEAPELKPVGNTAFFENQQGRLYDPMQQLIQPGSAEEAEVRQMIGQTRIQIGAPNAPVTPNWYTPGGTLVRAGERMEAVSPAYAPASPASPAYAAVTPPAGPPGAPMNRAYYTKQEYVNAG